MSTWIAASDSWGLFCKRALLKRRYSAKETYNFKEPTNLMIKWNRGKRLRRSAFGVCVYDALIYATWRIHMCEITNQTVIKSHKLRQAIEKPVALGAQLAQSHIWMRHTHLCVTWKAHSRSATAFVTHMNVSNTFYVRNQKHIPMGQKRPHMVPEPKGVCFKLWVIKSRSCFRHSLCSHIGDVLWNSEPDSRR